MATRLTREDRLDRLVEKTRRRVDDVPATTRLLRHMPKSKLGALVREAGYERTSAKFLEQLGERFRDAGIDFSPELLDPANTPETLIYLFAANRPVKGLQPTRQLFKVEEQLSRFLWLNHDFLSQATKNLRILAREKQLGPGSKIDLLAVDKKTRQLVGIELKAEEPDQGIVAQAAKYMRALKVLAEEEGRPGARLIIITGQPDDELSDLVQLQAEKLGVPTDWFLYRVKFELNKP